MKLTALTIRRLRRVAKAILDNPEKYDQGRGCGTAVCIAGHAYMLATKKKIIPHESCKWWDVKVTAMKWFSSEFTQHGADTFTALNRLFGVPNVDLYSWPKKLAEEYFKAPGDKGRARVGAMAIEDFIKTGGWDHAD